MKFYDLHVHVNDPDKIDEIVEMAQRLGFYGIGLTVTTLEELKKLKETIKKVNTNIDLITSVEIIASGTRDLKRKVSKFRKMAEVIIVYGGEYNINRIAAEDERVDIISHPEYKRKDSGLDEIIARSAKERNVAIEINFNEILETYRKIRSHVFNHMMKNISICKKHNTMMVISSDAKSPWEMRDPRELSSIGQILGMDLKESIDAVSTIPELMVESNRRKLKNF
ncbi:MAG: hypothetical protein J7L45_03355 [Candidatus Aenigmarchaeota archaeon]|nr:hypothetical protein [Candidatus Aenigmarchaeota archaeon]